MNTIDLTKYITRPLTRLTSKNKSENTKVLPSEGKKPSSASKTSKGEGLENLTVKKESKNNQNYRFEHRLSEKKKQLEKWN